VNHQNYQSRKARSGMSDSKLFSTVSYKLHNFVKIILSGINVSSFLYNTVREFFVPRSFYLDLIETSTSVFKYNNHYLLSQFNDNWILSTGCQNILQNNIAWISLQYDSCYSKKNWENARATMRAIRQLKWWLSFV